MALMKGMMIVRGAEMGATCWASPSIGECSLEGGKRIFKG